MIVYINHMNLLATEAKDTIKLNECNVFRGLGTAVELS